MEDDETILLPCPFCGGEARHYAPGPIDHHIECVECYADIQRDTEAEAIAAWNTRSKLENVTCGQCRHSRTERHKGDEELVCWVRVTYGEVVPEDGYCFKGEL